MNDFSHALPNELALVTQARADAAAFAALYDHYFSRVFNYVRYRLPDAQTADDVTAQVFERALNSIDSYRPEKAPFSAWLFAIARNAVNDQLRRQRRRRWISLDILSNRSSHEPGPVDIVSDTELQDELLAAVGRLGRRERDLIGLKFAAGLTNRRIAELTGLSESNVGIILFRTMRRLRAELKARGVER
jgi:RNA polymerase sigma factor (sigma-70 family)